MGHALSAIPLRTARGRWKSGGGRADPSGDFDPVWEPFLMVAWQADLLLL
jgi:hypothetical protein